MILQALAEYYHRKAGLPAFGFEEKEIAFIIVLDNDGKPIDLYSTYEGQGKNRRAKKFLVPQSVKRASNIAANILWDNPEYALGTISGGKPQRVLEQHEAFRTKISNLGDSSDPGLIAVRKFLSDPEKTALLESFGEPWKQLLEDGKNISFKLSGDTCIILERSEVKSLIEKQYSSHLKEQIICLITGERDSIERLHPSIKGVWGAQTTGGNIVSFNSAAFASFGKEQGANSPTGKHAAFAYTTALNHLLARDSIQRMQIGDASTVFWSERDTNFEQQFANFFGEPPKDEPDRNVIAVKSLFNSIQTGAFYTEESKNRFYVLGLSPNASRISIRFWIVDTIEGMAEKIAQHFQDLSIVHSPRESDFFSLFRLLTSIALERKSENVPPNLTGEMMRSILEGLPYPASLFQAAVRRNRAEQDVSYYRAAIIKACINRITRFKNSNIKEELKMSLEPENKNIGYLLGRLFATLEKIQEEANPGINATIRDRFYGSASGTPVTVFGNLMRLKNHHLAKLESDGRRIYLEKLIGSIIDGIDGKRGFPATLPIEDQGKFAIGYYHQRQDFFTKKEDKA